MLRMQRALIVLSLAGLLVGTAQAMPLRPDIAERLKSEGRIEEEKAFMEEAYIRGVNNFAATAVPGILGTPKAAAATSGCAIVIIVDFDDNLADTALYPASHYEELLFSVGTYPSGSMRDYYLENSYGNFDVTGEISGWHRMPRDYSYYVDGQRGFGTYPQNAQKLTEDAIAAADPYVDFSQYDNDGPDGIPDSGDDDGYVDALFVVHAGPGYETTGNPNYIHSHAWVTSSPVRVDGVYAYRYSMEPDDGNIGVFAHEFGHVLGLPDLYDYGYDSAGAGYWSLMASGSWGNGGTKPVHIDAWGKVQLGFVTPTVVTENLIDIAVPRVEVEPVIYRVWSNGAPGSEYFLFEHRRKVLFDVAVPGKGLVIYHIDENMSNNNNQRCGSGSPHYLVAVEQADGECDLEYDINSGDRGDPFPGADGVGNPNRAFNMISTPNTDSYAGNPTGVSIYNIHFADGMGYASIAVTEVAPSVTLTSPNGGEYFEPGGQDTIRWIAFDDLAVDSVSIMLSTDGGATFPHTIAHGEPNDSNLVWDITGPGSNQCRIKIVAYDSYGNTAEDVSDADFEIFDISGIPEVAPTDLDVLSVTPNPTLAGTRIVFSSPMRGAAAHVYDVGGRLVKDLTAEVVPKGSNTFEAYWDGRNSHGQYMAPGVYFLRIASGARARTARVTIAR